MNDPQICEICGISSPTEAIECAQCGRSFTQADGDLMLRGNTIDPLIASFGFRLSDVETSAFREAEVVFLSSFSSLAIAIDFGYKRDSVLENEDSYYFPVGWIGCVGHLVIKNSLRLIAFGSYIGPCTHIWANYQGISLEPLGKDRLNTLRILSISDEEKTLRVLKAFLNLKWVDRELSPKLSALPMELKDVDLYFGIRDLFGARENGWFKFEVF